MLSILLASQPVLAHLQATNKAPLFQAAKDEACAPGYDQYPTRWHPVPTAANMPLAIHHALMKYRCRKFADQMMPKVHPVTT